MDRPQKAPVATSFDMSNFKSVSKVSNSDRPVLKNESRFNASAWKFSIDEQDPE